MNDISDDIRQALDAAPPKLVSTDLVCRGKAYLVRDPFKGGGLLLAHPADAEKLAPLVLEGLLR